jgi:hypothetical protein
MKYRWPILFAPFFCIPLLAAADAEAVSLRTKIACLRDFRAYCSEHKVGSSQLRHCMNSNGPKLSKKCVDALVADGEISEEEVARRAATLNQ